MPILDQPLSACSPEELAAVKSEVINILREDPWLARFYAGYFEICRSNPSLLNILGEKSVLFSDLDLVLPTRKVYPKCRRDGAASLMVEVVPFSSKDMTSFFD